MQLPTEKNKGSVMIYKIVFYICAAMMTLITAYALTISLIEYFSTGRVVVGEILVNSEFPIKGLAKPVTYLQVSSVVGWYCVTRLGRSKTEGLSQTSLTLIKLIALTASLISLYELIYNFTVWNALMSADAIRGQLNIDILNIPYPEPNTPWSLVFATKMFLAAFLISAHAFYLTVRIDRDNR